MNGRVIIDCFPESAARYKEDHVLVVVDVIRATTTATTAVALGRRVFPVTTTDEAFVLAASLHDPLLAGELGGNMPDGFEMNNSPAHIAERSDFHRPMILLSSSGTRLLMNAAGAEAVYVSCFRNISALADHLARNHDRVAILGAGTRGQFRREDQMGCAWLAEKLMAAGYEAENRTTDEYVARWKGASCEEARGGRSAAYLKTSGQERDLDFVVSHIDDLEVVPLLADDRLIMASESRSRRGELRHARCGLK